MKSVGAQSPPVDWCWLCGAIRYYGQILAIWAFPSRAPRPVDARSFDESACDA
ncbi:hypothetical protein P692DRAFT_20830371 [Suillus brevipes Sb2]|nr:hypothetical protein P692DRAFT_20830371 [Suillus brevipes Sb2]